ncbi:MAG: metallophosphoesterase [Hyphomonadaceae bacterium]|nr:metallophosphoesterase [Hyphomonadaceae bacterium]
MHPHLLPALIGAILGAPIIAIAALRLRARWRSTAPAKRAAFSAALGALAIAYGLNVYAWLIEPNTLRVRHETVASAHWRGAPLTIALIGDTHVASPHVDARRVERIVARVNALQPDLVALLGDYAGSHEPAAVRADRENSAILQGVAAFAALDARYGVVAVIGNHDSWYDRQAIARALEEAGAAALWNRHVVIAREDGEFAVVGLADADTGDPDYARASDGVGARDRIVLTHSPDPFATLPGDVALTLAAHTHCGQVTAPFFGRLVVPSRFGARYACGVVTEGGRTMVVTGGVGTSILPVRFLNPPEIVLVTLRGAP